MTQQFNVTESEIKVIKSDLKRAKKYLAFLEEEKKKGKNSAASVREALSLAFAVAYSRPFTQCRRVGRTKRTPWIPNGLIGDLPTRFRELHENLIQQRDEVWAHTDEQAYDSTYPFIVLKRGLIPVYDQLIEQIANRLRAI